MTFDIPVRRREVLARLGAAGGLAALGYPCAAFGADPALHRRDWDWLVGNWDVFHRRLRERLANSNDWQEFGGKSALWLVLDGLGTIDDNVIEMPGGSYRGLTVRTYDTASDNWAIWWIDGRYPSVIDPPVIGGFSNGEGVFTGNFTFRDRPIVARFRWHDVRSKRPNWDQAFSNDGGESWEINWRNWFTRTSAETSTLPLLANAPADFAFLVGRWNVRHRKRRKRLADSQDWDEFGGTFVNWPVLGGAGNVGDNVMLHPAGTIRGIGLRTFDAKARTWSSWWFDGRNPHAPGPALRGRFSNGVGTFVTEDMLDGRPVLARATWSRVTSGSPRWEQSFSTDNGASWEVDWTSDFARAT